jgi:pilus assembly protein CpaB
MLSRTILLGLGMLALLAGLAMSYLWFNQSSMTGTGPTEAKVPMRSILVASHPLPANVFLRLGDMTWSDVPATEVVDTDIVHETASETDFVGAVTRSGFAAREPMTTAKLAKPSDPGFLAATLGPGYRAVSISVDVAQSASGLVMPGDRVDIVLLQTFPAQGPQSNDAGHRSSGETVLQNLRVIAADQMTNPSGRTSETISVTSEGRVPKTITLEATERQAAVLLVANRLGKIQLALRGQQQDDDAAPEQVPLVWASDVSPALRPPPVVATLPVTTQETPKTVDVIRASKFERLCQKAGSLVACQQEEQ